MCLGRAHGADDLLPVMMYVLARSNLSSLQLDVEYMMELMDPSLALGEGAPSRIKKNSFSASMFNKLLILALRLYVCVCVCVQVPII